MKRYPKYNQNQLTRSIVLEVVNAVALKYWTVDCFIFWFIEKLQKCWKATIPGVGHLPSFFIPTSGHLDSLCVSTPGNLPIFFQENAYAWG